MDKLTDINTFTELFEIILNEDRENSRKAAREVRKLLYSSRSDSKFNEIGNILEGVQKKYKNIQEDWRKENFVIAVSVVYFLHNKESQPDFLFPWLFSLIQDENGNIRNSARRMIENEIGPLTVHIRHPNSKFDKSFTTEQADFMLLNLFANLHNLLAIFFKPAYKKYKYIDSLPTSSYKTIQMILIRMEEDCGKEYMKKLESLSQFN